MFNLADDKAIDYTKKFANNIGPGLYNSGRSSFNGHSFNKYNHSSVFRFYSHNISPPRIEKKKEIVPEPGPGEYNVNISCFHFVEPKPRLYITSSYFN